MRRRRRNHFLTILLLLLLIPALGIAAEESRERVRVQYRVAYRLGFLKLLNLARVNLTLREESFVLPGTEKKIPALVVDLTIRPVNEEDAEKKRLFFDSHFQTVVDARTFRIVYYRKRIRENVRAIIVNSRKDYAEEVFYEIEKARVRREDFLAKTVEEKEVDLTAFQEGRKENAEVMDLPALLAKALFQPGYFSSIQNVKRKYMAQMITKTRLYEFELETKGIRHVGSPLTGRVRATRVETNVVFRSRNNEMVPFVLWMTAPEDLPPALQERVREANLYCFPTVIKLDFTVGSLRVMAEEVETPSEAGKRQIAR